jgi:hypothetical protein
MSRSTLARYACLGVVVALILTAIGCFESKYPAGPKQPGKVDRRFVGNWIVEQRDQDGQTNTSRLIVRNLHDEQYYIEWQTGDEAPFRATGWLNEVNGVMFASLLPLTDDGQIAQKYTIMRVDWDGERFEARNLDGDFFKDKSFDSSDALRGLLEKHLNDEQMYKGEPLMASREK